MGLFCNPSYSGLILKGTGIPGAHVDQPVPCCVVLGPQWTWQRCNQAPMVAISFCLHVGGEVCNRVTCIECGVSEVWCQFLHLTLM